MIATSSAARAITVPHGSMIIERPWQRYPAGIPDLGRGDDGGAVPDRPGPEQDVQVIAPGPLEEVGRHGQDLGPGDRQRAIQLGKAQVVADRQADLRPVHVAGHGPVARREPDRFPVGWAILELDVEQVDLAISGRDRAARVDQDARVVRPAGRPRLGQRAGQDPHAVLWATAAKASLNGPGIGRQMR